VRGEEEGVREDEGEGVCALGLFGGGALRRAGGDIVDREGRSAGHLSAVGGGMKDKERKAIRSVHGNNKDGSRACEGEGVSGEEIEVAFDRVATKKLFSSKISGSS
jgi:CRISPR/Cas system CSM-associated protein Csm3 (group 7 of RAMP superfamily)